MLDKNTLDRLTSRGGNRLIVGPPGSGKTYTLLAIVRYLVNKKGVDPSRIIIFTFNRRWSKILREETVKLLDRSMWELPIGTFFSFCNDFLAWKDLRSIKDGQPRGELNAFTGGYPGGDGDYPGPGDNNILNSATQWNMLRDLVSRVDRRDYPYSFRYFHSTGYVANSFLQEVFDFILRSQENLLRPAELLQRFTPHNNPVLAELAGIYSRYIGMLRQQGKSNYGMLLQDTETALREDPLIRKEWKEKYDYILIDELQETNKAQLEIIKNISRDNCIFFGNDDQAVHNFRGGISDNFLQVHRSLIASKKVYFLKSNHRSAKNIVEVSNRFIGSNLNRIPKKNIGISSGGEVQVRDFDSMLEETEYIADRIISLERKEEIKPENIAVIIKGLGYETHLIENALKQSGIAFIRRSSRSMLDNHYVLYIINYLRLIISLDDIEKKDQDGTNMASGGNGQNYMSGQHKMDGLLENHLLSEISGLDPLFYIKLRSDYLRYRDPTIPDTGRKNPSFWEHICKNLEKDLPGIPDGESAGWEKLKGIISSLNKSLEAVVGNIYEFLMDFLEDPVSGLFRLLKEKDAVSYPGYFYSSWVGIGDFLESIKEYCIVEPESDIRSYTGYLENLIENNFLEEIEESTREQTQKGMVNILSFHQCKGLEYDAVFIPFINNNYLPSKFRQPQIFDLEIFRAIDGGRELSSGQIQKEHMESEVRLFYNGLTRARKKLYITSTRSKGISTFFKKIQAAARDIDNGEEDQDSAGTTAKSRLKEMEVFDEMDKKWLAKKKTMVALERAGSGLKVDYEYLIKRVVELKYLYPVDDWWNLVQPTINNNIPYKVYPPLFNYSGLNIYRDCPFKYKVKYFYKIPEEENLNLIVGRIYHSALKDFFDIQPKDRSWMKFTDIIGKNFETEQFDFLFIKEELLFMAMKDFKRYFENFMPPAQARTIMEKEFKFSLGDNKIRGRIDQINQFDDGSIELVDFKSGSTRYSSRDLEEEMQLRFYRLALDSDKNLKELKKGKVLLKYLSLGDDRKTEYMMPEGHYNKEETKILINELAGKIKKEKFIPAPGSYMSCRYCDCKILCPRFYGSEK